MDHSRTDNQCALPDGHEGPHQIYLTCVCGHLNTQHFENPELMDTRCWADRNCFCQEFRLLPVSRLPTTTRED